MSNYPGYPPPPFNAWDSFTSAIRTPFPLGTLTVPGLSPGIPNSFADSGYLPVRPSFPDSLLSVGSGVYRPLPSRYLPGVSELPTLGLEPLYGFGPQEPRSLLHSPNFSFSQNPSPLTFDQIYRSSGASSVSPVSQYRNHFDQRYISGHIPLPGRYTDPLCGQGHSLISVKRDKTDNSEIVKHVKEKTSHNFVDGIKKVNEDKKEKSVKLWNPFVSDISENRIYNSDPNKKVAKDTIKKSSSQESTSNNKAESFDANGNNVVKLTSEQSGITRKPQYPIRPIPVFSAHCASSPFEHFQPPNLPNKLYSAFQTPQDNIDENRKGEKEQVIEIDSENLRKDLKAEESCEVIDVKPGFECDVIDLNQNCEIVKNSNLCSEKEVSDKAGKTEDNKTDQVKGRKTENSFAIESTYESNNLEQEDFCIIVEDSAQGVESSDNKESEETTEHIVVKDIGNKCDFQTEFSNFLAKSVPYSSDIHINVSDSLPEENSVNSVPKSSTLSSPVLCSPKVNESKCKTVAKQKSACNKREELKQLSIQVNEVRKRRNSLNKDSGSEKVLSPPLESAPKSRRCLARERRFSHPPVSGSSSSSHHRIRMSSAEGAITMLKNTEDSLSASISSSHLSESDSDTQMSNDNAEKLFRESQPLNTQSTYSANQNLSQNYMPSLNMDQMREDNQYYKTNTPQMCQSDSDNQKPYPCVQEQTMFNEKSTVLPPFSCYSSNQSADVLPREPSFHSQEENSNFPPNLGGVDSSMEYHDESSAMSESNPLPQDSESQHSISQNVEPMANKDSMLQGNNHPMANMESYIHDPGEWDFLHSKQYIENIYGNQIGCEIVKNEDELRESDSPKTFLDLDTTTKETKAQETTKGKPIKESMGGKHYPKSYARHSYVAAHRHGPGAYSNQSMEAYGNGSAGNRWNSFPRNDGMMRPQPRPGSEAYTGHFEQNPPPPQFRGNFPPPNYPHMNQSQNGGDKTFIQPGYHGNEYNQNDYYNQNQSMKNYQGNYNSNPRYENNFYQKQGGNEFNSQSNMYPSNSGDMQGSARFGNQGFPGGQGGYGQHYNQPPSSHSGSENMGQYPDTTSYSIPRNASPASTGSDFSNMEAPGAIVKKKRGRKRKVDKEPPDENKPRPNTVVMAPTKIGPLIDIDNPECTIDTYDYNNQIETIFNFTIDDDLSPIGAQFLQIEQRICQKMLPIKYGYPVTVVYSPLTYAFQTHRDFVSKFCTSERTILFLGMNPGPYGMSQNGVPFGEAVLTREWLKISGKVYKPEVEHPKKPVLGLACLKNEVPFGEAVITRNWLKITGDVYKPEIEHPKKLITGLACTRNEVSGARFWGLFHKVCKVPANFFKNSFVYNFCPLAYMSESGKNITPPQLVHSELDQINEACDAGLVELVKLLNIRMVIAVGKFVQQRASKALHNAGIMNIKVECILHPSPINPHANKGWEQIVAKQLIEMNVMHYLNNDMEDVQRCIDEWERIAQSNVKVPVVAKEDY